MKLLGAVIAKRYPFEPDRYLANARDLQRDNANNLCIGVWMHVCPVKPGA